jgi:hypothetical protein
MSNIENLSDNELREIKAFVRGLIEGVKDSNTPERVDFILEDYWNAWDNTIDINIWIDESDPQKYLCTLYSVFNNIRNDEEFQRLDYLKS